MGQSKDLVASRVPFVIVVVEVEVDGEVEVESEVEFVDVVPKREIGAGYGM